MIALVTIEEAKAWLRVDTDEEDATIDTLIAAASAAAFDMADGWLPVEGEPVPDRIRLAVLTHVAQAFDNREGGADMPASAGRLLWPLRRLAL